MKPTVPAWIAEIPGAIRGPVMKSCMPDVYTDAQWTMLIEQQRHEANMNAMPQADALMGAGWRFVVAERDLELWQWQWRSPPKRKGSQGRLYLSTQQAYNALQRYESKG